MAAKKISEFRLQAVGVVRSGLEPGKWPAGDQDRRAWAEKIKNHVSQVEIGPGLEGILDGIEDFSHLLVIYWPHLVPESRRRCRRVRPMRRKDLPLKGVFATCSPARPNPLLVSVVELVGRKGQVLFVRGLDAWEGSPVLDVKPYVGSLYRVDRPGMPRWMEKISADFSEPEASGKETENGCRASIGK